MKEVGLFKKCHKPFEKQWMVQIHFKITPFKTYTLLFKYTAVLERLGWSSQIK